MLPGLFQRDSDHKSLSISKPPVYRPVIESTLRVNQLGGRSAAAAGRRIASRPGFEGFK
jgi:hypothetical protein